MGGLLINNKELRCKDCFKLYSFIIKPTFPTCVISKTCTCSTTEMEIPKFLTEYKKNKSLSISCAQCKKNNPKEPKYCYNCHKLYCINCCKTIHNEEKNKDHKVIVIEKYDFFCVTHQNDNFCAYCKNCNIDICVKCGNEKLHEGHKILLYHKIYDEKKMREYLKKAIKYAEEKIDYNSKISQMIVKEVKKNEMIKNIKTLNDISQDENKKILELINIFYELYDVSKPKNYCIIMNLIDNIHFNLERIKFEQNSTKENDVQLLINYYKTDFILEVKEKKEKVQTTLEEQFYNDKCDLQKKEGNEEVKKEEKKEDNEEEKEENDDGKRRKTLKEKKEIIERKISKKGGFQNPETIKPKSNDIINEPRGTPNNVVNILSNQTINNKVKKKKPKKINFQA